ncbi:hypothetical protein G1E_32245 [Pseudomonas sp. TJI-51]|nr:rolling circle replication protein, Rep63 protein [Burkholderia sp. TJI49]KLJ14548.1 hypothetical protein G1E_32245 [Pseudomonas sp. TJI-51]
MQQYAQRLLSRPQYWQEREKTFAAPYTDLRAKVAYCDLELNRHRGPGVPVKVSKVLATEIGLPVVRHKLYGIEGTVNKSPKFRVVSCYRRKVPGKQAELWQHRESGAVNWHQVAVCGSVWTCPICSAKINRARREEIADAYNGVAGIEGSAYMLTFTIKHGIGDELSELLAKFKEAMQHLQKSPAFKEVTRAHPLKRPQAGSMPFLGYIGRIANLEVTHGSRNGWHPHEHHLWFFRRELTAQEVALLRDRLFAAWAEACKAVGLPAPLKTVKVGGSVRYLGLDVRKALSAQEYLTKFSQFTGDGERRERRWGPEHELAGAHVKAARAKGATPFQLLFEASQGDKAAGQRFAEFAEAFLGRHQLQFSRSLKAFLATLEKPVVVDDSEAGDMALAARKEEDSELLLALSDHEFDKVVRNRAQSLVLLLARRHGLKAVVDYIAALPPYPPAYFERPDPDD